MKMGCVKSQKYGFGSLKHLLMKRHINWYPLKKFKGGGQKAIPRFRNRILKFRKKIPKSRKKILKVRKKILKFRFFGSVVN